MELILYDPITVINTENVSVSDNITFNFHGQKANGVITSIAADGRSMAVYATYVDTGGTITVTIKADEINAINFSMMKWADYGFTTIETVLERAVTGAYLAYINSAELALGSAFWYMLNDDSQPVMGLVSGATATYIDLVLKDKRSQRITLETIILGTFKCRWSSDLLVVEGYPSDITPVAIAYLQTADGQTVILKE